MCCFSLLMYLSENGLLSNEYLVFSSVGAKDVISFQIETDEPYQDEQHIIFKELSIRKEYDFVFFTTATEYNKEFIRSFVSPRGLVIDCVELPIASDDYSEIGKLFYSVNF